jgi:hypothetical protein
LDQPLELNKGAAPSVHELTQSLSAASCTLDNIFGKVWMFVISPLQLRATSEYEVHIRLNAIVKFADMPVLHENAG